MNKEMINLINQVFEIEQKLARIDDTLRLGRNTDRMKHELQLLGFTFSDPTGQHFDESRTDCDANILGELSESMYISKVLKPVVYYESEGLKTVVQRAVAIVEPEKQA
jgi:hypothetical protein